MTRRLRNWKALAMTTALALLPAAIAHSAEDTLLCNVFEFRQSATNCSSEFGTNLDFRLLRTDATADIDFADAALPETEPLTRETTTADGVLYSYESPDGLAVQRLMGSSQPSLTATLTIAPRDGGILNTINAIYAPLEEA